MFAGMCSGPVRGPGCRCRWLEKGHWQALGSLLWCGACCWVPGPPPASPVWGGVVFRAPHGVSLPVFGCGVSCAGWWFENWRVDASVTRPRVFRGSCVRLVLRPPSPVGGGGSL